MKKYIGKKRNFVTNFFNNCARIKKDKEVLEKQLLKSQKALFFLQKNGSTPQELSEMQDYITNLESKLYRAQKNYEKKNKTVAKLATCLGLSLTLISSGIAFSNISNANNQFHENFTSGYSYTQDNENSTDDVSYLSFKDDLERYVELSNKETLSNQEQQEIKNVKTRIRSNPQSVTKFSLEILKTKIASALNIDDFNRITIIDNSTDHYPDQYDHRKGYIQNICIYIDNEPTYSCYNYTELSSGDTLVYKDEIPEEVVSAIKKVVASQREPEDLNCAYKTLESSLKLETKGLTFEKDIEDTSRY